jgi:hypothetical protein
MSLVAVDGDKKKMFPVKTAYAHSNDCPLSTMHVPEVIEPSFIHTVNKYILIFGGIEPT